MDGHRFDRLTRGLARSTSRRGGLRLLAAVGASFLAVARGNGKAAAQDWYRTAGEPCWDSDQCVAADAPLICANNGFAYDGPYHCCTFEGSRCGTDEHCCGTAYCADGRICRALAGGSRLANIDTGRPVSWQGVGDPCQTTDQCNRSRTESICEYTVSTGDKRCCWYEGECASGAQCCGGRVCANGYCQFPSGGTRGGSGAACTWAGCTCLLWRDPDCRASCPLFDPCDPGLVCTGSSEEIGTCVPA